MADSKFHQVKQVHTYFFARWKKFSRQSLFSGTAKALKFIYSEKANKFCEISTLLLSVCTEDKGNVEILQNFVAFSEYMNFKNRFHKLILFAEVGAKSQQGCNISQ